MPEAAASAPCRSEAREEPQENLNTEEAQPVEKTQSVCVPAHSHIPWNPSPPRP